MTENIAYCSMRTEFNLHHNVQFYRFRTFHVWTVENVSKRSHERERSMHFDDNENAYFWKTYQCGQGLAKGASIVIIRRAQNKQQQRQQ